MIEVTHDGTTPFPVKTINAVMTSNLSASGSVNFPKLVTRWCRRAICPSRLSVIVAAINKIAPISWAIGIVAPQKLTAPQLCNGRTINNKKKGIIIKRITVSLFGKFNVLTPLVLLY